MRPLSDKLPLRLTTELQLPGAAQAIPHVYGRAWVRGYQYDAVGSLWLVADHACEQLLDAVDADGKGIGGAVLLNTSDLTGHSVALVRLAASADESPSFYLDGKPHPESGAVMRNPAAIVWDILANIGGQDLAESELAEFSHACTGIELGGSLDSGTIRAAVDQVMQSAGAYWSSGTPGLARLRPLDTAPRRSYDHTMMANIRLACDSSKLANSAELLYDYALGEPGNKLAATEPQSIARFGRIETSIEAPWLRTPARAAALLELELSERSRPMWSLSVDVDYDEEIYPGDYVDVSQPQVPDVGPWLVVEAAPDLEGVRTSLVLRAWAGAAPTVAAVEATFDERMSGGQRSSVSIAAVPKAAAAVSEAADAEELQAGAGIRISDRRISARSKVGDIDADRTIDGSEDMKIFRVTNDPTITLPVPSETGITDGFTFTLVNRATQYVITAPDSLLVGPTGDMATATMTTPNGPAVVTLLDASDIGTWLVSGCVT